MIPNHISYCYYNRITSLHLRNQGISRHFDGMQNYLGRNLWKHGMQKHAITLVDICITSVFMIAKIWAIHKNGLIWGWWSMFGAISFYNSQYFQLFWTWYNLDSPYVHVKASYSNCLLMMPLCFRQRKTWNAIWAFEQCNNTYITVL